MGRYPKRPCPVCRRPTPVYRRTETLWTHFRDGRECRGSGLVIDLYGDSATHTHTERSYR